MKHFVKSLPVLSILLALACDTLLPDSAQHPAAEHPYFTWALLIGLAVYVTCPADIARQHQGTR